uniref:Uncharacterized protein n=1 Tax=Rhizophora mucronata TaxID=61149 RepID=A0A2P2IL77_RHIMU
MPFNVPLSMHLCVYLCVTAYMRVWLALRELGMMQHPPSFYKQPS